MNSSLLSCRFFSARLVPYVLHEQVEKEVDRLLQDGSANCLGHQIDELGDSNQYLTRWKPYYS